MVYTGSSSSSSSLSNSEGESEGNAGQTHHTQHAMENQVGNLSLNQRASSSATNNGNVSEKQVSDDASVVDKPVDNATRELQELTKKIYKAIELRSKTPSRIWFEGKKLLYINIS